MSEPLHILLVDDNPNDRILVIRELRRTFEQVIVHQINRPQALAEALEEGDYDLVITDYQLHWSNGIEVLKEVKSRWPNCPVVMFTGTGSEEIAVEAMQAGLDDYVLKSAKHVSRLSAAVRSALERTAQQRALQEAETRYQALFEGIPVGLYRSTPEGRLVEVNPALVKMLHYPDRETLLQADASALYLDPNRRQQWQEKMDQEDVVPNFEARFLCYDGSIIWARDTARVVRDEAGRPLYYEGSLEDITEQQRMKEELVKATRMESLLILAGGVAHDFNNILTAIIGNISVAKQYLRAEDPVYQILQDAELASLRAQGLTRQLLTFSRESAPLKEPLDLGRVIRNAVEFALRGSPSRCACVLPDGLWTVEADETQIVRVLHNLILNADQAMPGGGLIQVQAENVLLSSDSPLNLKPGRYVHISVRDHGPGIPPELLDRIFEPFFTTKASGTGLGLAISASIMEKHGGTITVESEVGSGATFHLYLPASEKAIVPAAGEAVPPAKGQGRILVMDDEGIVRQITTRMLEYLGFRCETVADGAEAIARYIEALEQSDPFDVVILDLTVPDGTGAVQTLKRLRAIDPEVRAIVSSGYTNDLVVAHYQKHGFAGLLIKPYQIEDLARALRRVLEEG